MVLSFCFGPFIICQCQSWSQSVSFAFHFHLLAVVLLLRLGLCLRFVKMEMKKICTVAAFVAFFRADADGSRRTDGRRDGRGRLGVRMSFLIISVFAFFAFALFLVHLCTLFTPLPLPLPLPPVLVCPPGCHLSCIFMRISKSPVQVLRESCAHLLRAAI